MTALFSAIHIAQAQRHHSRTHLSVLDERIQISKSTIKSLIIGFSPAQIDSIITQNQVDQE